MTKFKFPHFFRPKKWQSPNFQAVSELFHSEFRTLFGISCYGLSVLISYFFALDHMNYARWLPIHLRDMIALETLHPIIY